MCAYVLVCLKLSMYTRATCEHLRRVQNTMLFRDDDDDVEHVELCGVAFTFLNKQYSAVATTPFVDSCVFAAYMLY